MKTLILPSGRTLKISNRSEIQLFCDSIWESLKSNGVKFTNYPLLLGMVKNKGREKVYQASAELIRYQPKEPEKYFKKLMGK